MTMGLERCRKYYDSSNDALAKIEMSVRIMDSAPFPFMHSKMAHIRGRNQMDMNHITVVIVDMVP